MEEYGITPQYRHKVLVAINASLARLHYRECALKPTVIYLESIRPPGSLGQVLQIVLRTQHNVDRGPRTESNDLAVPEFCQCYDANQISV